MAETITFWKAGTNLTMERVDIHGNADFHMGEPRHFPIHHSHTWKTYKWLTCPSFEGLFEVRGDVDALERIWKNHVPRHDMTRAHMPIIYVSPETLKQ